MEKTLYYESKSHDPSFNLALEQYLFDTLPAGTRLFMLWQNDNAIIIGRFQNAEAEINASFVRENNIRVVRRPTGGGAVYHDLGNINYTFITDTEPGTMPDFGVFCEPVVRVLRACGVAAEITGRNDICVDGKKISGTAQHAAGSRVMHHGTLLYDSNMDVLTKALRISRDKYATRALSSVRSRVANIRPLMERDYRVQDFINLLRQEILKDIPYEEYVLTKKDRAAIGRIRKERYGNWDWNFGVSPAYNVMRSRYFPGCGTVELRLNVENGVIRTAEINGDFFCNGDITEPEHALEGALMKESDLLAALSECRVDRYLRGVSNEAFVAFLLGYTDSEEK